MKRLAFIVFALLEFSCSTLALRIDRQTVCRSLFGPLQLRSLDAQRVDFRGVELLEGSVLALSRSAEGNKNLRFFFDQCDLPSFGFTSGTSRNSAGSMGAPIEYFGHVRLGDRACLTAVFDASDSSDETSAIVKLLPCTYEDDTEQLLQFFVLAIGATGAASISLIGDKNSSANLYRGPHNYWQPSTHKQAHRPRPVLITNVPSQYVMFIDEKYL